MEAYSLDLRKRVLAACDAGHRTKEVARLFDVSPAWVRRLKQRRRELGTIAPLPPRYGYPSRFTEEDLRRLRQLVNERPDATLKELRELLQVDAALSTLCEALKRMKLRVKKKSSTPASKTGRMSRSSDGSGTDSSTG
jgi:transposase